MEELEAKIRSLMCKLKRQDGEEKEEKEDDSRDEDFEEGLEEACQLLKSDLNLQEDFESIVDLLTALCDDWNEDILFKKSTSALLDQILVYREMAGGEDEAKLKTILEFLALIGGVVQIHKLYEKAVKATGHSRVVSESTFMIADRDDENKKRAKQLAHGLHQFWIIATDESPEVCECLSETGYLLKLIEDIDFIYDASLHMSEDRVKFLIEAVGIVYDIAQCGGVYDAFREHQLGDQRTAVDVFINMLSTTCLDLKTVVLLTLSHIVDDDNKEEVGHLQADEELDHLLGLIPEAWRSDNLRTSGGFKLDELLIGLCYLTVNDKCKRILMQKGVVKLLLEIMVNGNEEAKAQACDIVWGLTWDNENAKEMQIRDELKKNNYKVWLDVDEMTGNIDDRMAEAVENADVFLLCMSRTYQASNNCRAEAQYALKKKKTVLPLKLEKDFEPSGWLGLRLSDLKYYDISDAALFDENLSQLFRDMARMTKE